MDYPVPDISYKSPGPQTALGFNSGPLYGDTPQPVLSSNPGPLYGVASGPALSSHSGSLYGAAPQPAQGYRPGSLAAQQWHPPPHDNRTSYGSYPAPPYYGSRLPPVQPSSLFGINAPPQSLYSRPINEPRMPLPLPSNDGGIPPPPPDTHTQLFQLFQNVDQNRSGALTPDELSRALVNGYGTPFRLDTVRMLMGLFDMDRSGMIYFEEFVSLWKYVTDRYIVFRCFDQDQSGMIEGSQLASAIKQFGFNLSPNLFILLGQRYVTMPSAAGATGGISFDGFVRACLMMNTVTESFKRADTDNDGWINISYEDFIEVAITAP